jgi:hypothetical protein
VTGYHLSNHYKTQLACTGRIPIKALRPVEKFFYCF